MPCNIYILDFSILIFYLYIYKCQENQLVELVGEANELLVTPLAKEDGVAKQVRTKKE